jgi:predicted amidohydrolase
MIFISLPASTLALLEDGSYVNRARLFAPEGQIGVQDKIIMTRFEREPWGVSSGSSTLRLFDTRLGRIGINICYDCEFPLLARAQVEAGMELLLVSLCTEKEHGYWRVRIGAQARALENQMYVIHSPKVGGGGVPHHISFIVS